MTNDRHGGMTAQDMQAKAEDPAMLERMIMDPRLPKTAQEWWAASEIERLRKEFSQARAQAATYRENLDKLHPRLDAKNAEIAVLSHNSSLVRQEGWKAGMEEAAGMMDPYCTELPRRIRARINEGKD